MLPEGCGENWVYTLTTKRNFIAFNHVPDGWARVRCQTNENIPHHQPLLHMHLFIYMYILISLSLLLLLLLYACICIYNYILIYMQIRNAGYRIIKLAVKSREPISLITQMILDSNQFTRRSNNFYILYIQHVDI